MTDSKKEILDKIILKYKGVGASGYFEIIIPRIFYKEFIKDVLGNDLIISGIFWYDYVGNLEKDRIPFGLGGPRSKHFDGYYSELCAWEDEVTKEMGLEDIYKIVEEKTISGYFDGKNKSEISFKNNTSLTPAFSIVVPEDWVYNYD